MQDTHTRIECPICRNDVGPADGQEEYRHAARCTATVRYDWNDGYPRQIIDLATCGHCGRTWNDATVSHMTPAPSARCPFEYDHEYEDGDQ